MLVKTWKTSSFASSSLPSMMLRKLNAVLFTSTRSIRSVARLITSLSPVTFQAKECNKPCSRFLKVLSATFRRKAVASIRTKNIFSSILPIFSSSVVGHSSVSIRSCRAVSVPKRWASIPSATDTKTKCRSANYSAKRNRKILSTLV